MLREIVRLKKMPVKDEDWETIAKDNWRLGSYNNYYTCI